MVYTSEEINLASNGVILQADLCWPESAQGVVVFAHGSGSSRRSPRNRCVAEGLQAVGLATLLLDLLIPEEEAEDRQTHHWRFDIPFLAARLTGAVDWLLQTEIRTSRPVPIGLFGASTGAAAALLTAAASPRDIRALVSRGGRPDLAARGIPQVRCPSLFIVGGADLEVLALHKQALMAMTAPHHLAVLPGASHLFGEPGALERVTILTKEWFLHHLFPSASP